jgi:hypothetical protein
MLTVSFADKRYVDTSILGWEYLFLWAVSARQASPSCSSPVVCIGYQRSHCIHDSSCISVYPYIDDCALISNRFGCNSSFVYIPSAGYVKTKKSPPLEFSEACYSMHFARLVGDLGAIASSRSPVVKMFHYLDCWYGIRSDKFQSCLTPWLDME